MGTRASGNLSAECANDDGRTNAAATSSAAKDPRKGECASSQHSFQDASADAQVSDEDRESLTREWANRLLLPALDDVAAKNIGPINVGIVRGIRWVRWTWLL